MVRAALTNSFVGFPHPSFLTQPGTNLLQGLLLLERPVKSWTNWSLTSALPNPQGTREKGKHGEIWGWLTSQASLLCIFPPNSLADQKWCQGCGGDQTLPLHMEGEDLHSTLAEQLLALALSWTHHSLSLTQPSNSRVTLSVCWLIISSFQLFLSFPVRRTAQQPTEGLGTLPASAAFSLFAVSGDGSSWCSRWPRLVPARSRRWGWSLAPAIWQQFQHSDPAKKDGEKEKINLIRGVTTEALLLSADGLSSVFSCPKAKTPPGLKWPWVLQWGQWEVEECSDF